MNLPSPEELNKQAQKLKEDAVRREGEEMLKQIAKAKSGDEPAMVGPDGKPIVKPTEQPKQRVVRQRKQRSREEIEAMSNYMKTLMEKDPNIRDLANATLDLYQLLFWVINDLSIQDGMTEELAEYVGETCVASAKYNKIHIGNVLENLRGNTVPFLLRRKDFYAKVDKMIKARLNRLPKSVLMHGISLPVYFPKEHYQPKGFELGSMMILRGDPAVVSDAIRSLLRHHNVADDSKAAILSVVDEKDNALTVIPRVWWEKTGDEYPKLEEALASVVNGKSAVLGVDDISVLGSDLGKTVAKLYQWGVNNAVSVIVGESSNSPVTFVGPFKRFLVTRELNGTFGFSLVETGK